MKKLLTIELSGEWVFAHRGDDELPVELLKSELQKLGEFEIKDYSHTAISVLFDDEKVQAESAKAAVEKALAERYSGEDLQDIIAFEVKDAQSDIEEREKAEERDAELEMLDRLFGENCGEVEKSTSTDAQSVLEEINKLVGAEEFKALAEEIVKIAPEVVRRKTQEIFYNQCYLFSVGDGCGLSTYLKLLARLINASGIIKIVPRNVTECKIAPYKEGMDPFAEAIGILKSGDADSVRLLCVDISEWIGRTHNGCFKQFLRTVEKFNDRFIVVFRVPFLDKDVLSDLRFSLNDLLSVKTVSFPPLSRKEIKIFANNELEKYGFKATKSCWEFFQTRITEEKSDGKFYGHNTVKKVVRELVYNKQLENVKGKKPSDIITRSDTKTLCGIVEKNELSGTEQLNRLVGNEKVKKQIEEIIAQIELAIKENSADRPCIHMRFVGNPGTGKTTVARIVGKILKERGVLRIGNFYEYAGRDFCGRYVGETAPKTAGICRDAYGSVLFIDEAYSLYRGDGNDRDYGREAIDTLIAEMENHRSDLVVIMAGYTDDMDKLMEGNSGLKSRMPYTIEFPNFTREQLYEIYASMVKSKFRHDEHILEAAHAYFTSLSEELISSKEFSNARFVRNLFERTWAKAAMRCQLGSKAEIVLTKDDFERASAEKDFAFNIKKKTVIGF